MFFFLTCQTFMFVNLPNIYVCLVYPINRFAGWGMAGGRAGGRAGGTLFVSGALRESYCSGSLQILYTISPYALVVPFDNYICIMIIVSL
jgi:ABC-type sulfate transport system permease subunit